MSSILPPFEERAELVLARAFRGIHHVRRIKKLPNIWTTSAYGGLATFDFDTLTRLVIAAHDHCVRVEVTHSGPKMVKIYISQREREGDGFVRHPTIEEAIQTFREGK
jgi:hypothetical protein